MTAESKFNGMETGLVQVNYGLKRCEFFSTTSRTWTMTFKENYTHIRITFSGFLSKTSINVVSLIHFKCAGFITGNKLSLEEILSKFSILISLILTLRTLELQFLSIIMDLKWKKNSILLLTYIKKMNMDKHDKLK